MSDLKSLAPDLANGEFPRSPREPIGGYVVAARTLDKCRAEIAGTHGEYHFNCPLAQYFFRFAEITADAFRDFVATGADDGAVAKWINEHAKKRERSEVIQWNNDMRYMRINEMPIELQEFLEEYIPEVVPAGKVVNHWFDVYDIEEGRI